MKYLMVVALLFSTAAQAASVRGAQEAAKREKLIKDLSEKPASANNICRGC